jgi:CheY-like chemotaxis protein
VILVRFALRPSRLGPSPEERPRILVVDDEKVIRDMLAEFLGSEGYYVRTAEDGTVAVKELAAGPFDVVISDLKMPKMGGIALLDEVSRAAPDALTVIMTGFGTVETAIDAMKRGAYDYVLKPFKLDEVMHVQRGLEKQRLAAENLRLREAVSLYKVSEAIAASLCPWSRCSRRGRRLPARGAQRSRVDLARRRRVASYFERQHISRPDAPRRREASWGASIHGRCSRTSSPRRRCSSTARGRGASSRRPPICRCSRSWRCPCA